MITGTVTNVVGGSYPSDTYIFDDTQYINPQRANNPSHAQYKVNGVVTDSSNVNNKAFSSYDQYIYSAVDSNGNNVLTGTNVKPTALNTSTHSVTFDTAQNWPNGTVVTLRMKSYGYYTKRSDAFGSGTSLEGHVLPSKGGITIDLSNMKKILEVNTNDLIN